MIPNDDDECEYMDCVFRTRTIPTKTLDLSYLEGKLCVSIMLFSIDDSTPLSCHTL